jgi:hypothetical protein
MSPALSFANDVARRGTVIVASALAIYIIRAAPPVAGVNFSIAGASLRLVLFKWPWQSALATDEDVHAIRQPQDCRKGRTTDGSFSSSSGLRSLEAAVEGIDVTWVEKLLNQRGFAYITKPTTSDAQTTAEITLQIQYAQPAHKAVKGRLEEESGPREGAMNGKKGQGVDDDGRRFPSAKQVQYEDVRSGRGFER